MVVQWKGRRAGHEAKEQAWREVLAEQARSRLQDALCLGAIGMIFWNAAPTSGCGDKFLATKIPFAGASYL